MCQTGVLAPILCLIPWVLLGSFLSTSVAPKPNKIKVCSTVRNAVFSETETRCKEAWKCFCVGEFALLAAEILLLACEPVGMMRSPEGRPQSTDPSPSPSRLDSQTWEERSFHQSLGHTRKSWEVINVCCFKSLLSGMYYYRSQRIGNCKPGCENCFMYTGTRSVTLFLCRGFVFN